MLAFAIAVVADVLEFPITGAELTIVGAPEAEFAAFVLDCIVMGAMTRILGFHWMFLPTFCVEVIPGLDMLPTWAGCVAFVVWRRKKEEAEQAKMPPLNSVIDVQEVTVVSAAPAARLVSPPPLLAPAKIPVQTPPPIEGDVERRLKKLDDLRGRSMISQAEYEAKRQQILGEI